MSIFCKIGLHRWKDKYVYTKKRREHLRGNEIMQPDKEYLEHGRECKWCKREQYMYMPWINLYYFDVIKP